MTGPSQLRVDPFAKPKEIDIVAPAAGGKEKARLGIYRLAFFDGHVEAKPGREVVAEGYAILPQAAVVWTADPDQDPNITY